MSGQTDVTDTDTPDLRARQEDEWLAVRCQLGEPEAFDALIARWQPPLWTYVRRMVGQDDEARDVMQDVWVKVVRGIARLRDGSRLRAWLFGITRRTMMDRLRRRYAAPASVEIDLADASAAPVESDVLDREMDLAALDNALADLPALERETLTLFYLHELSLAEVAEALDVPAGTVKSRLFRGRRLLRAALSPRG
jgi:RNA polymerase sigma factor (sigma-70 family)